MFKNLISRLKMMQQERKYKRNIDLNSKRFQVRNALIKWYMDYDKMYDVCDIPAHIRADRVIDKHLKCPADVDRAYKKLLAYQQAI